MFDFLSQYQIHMAFRRVVKYLQKFFNKYLFFAELYITI